MSAPSPHAPALPAAGPPASSASLRSLPIPSARVALVWETNRHLAITLALLTLAAGLLPAAMAWVGKLIVDGVLVQMAT